MGRDEDTSLSPRDERSDELAEMEARKDAAYLERNQVVAALASVFPAGIARTDIPGWSEDWHGCVYIDLPTGQASWHYHDSHAWLFAHLSPYTKPWDGHTTEEKYARLAALSAWAAVSSRKAVERLDASRTLAAEVDPRSRNADTQVEPSGRKIG